jgi:hypothetical protein
MKEGMGAGPVGVGTGVGASVGVGATARLGADAVAEDRPTGAGTHAARSAVRLRTRRKRVGAGVRGFLTAGGP